MQRQSAAVAMIALAAHLAAVQTVAGGEANQGWQPAEPLDRVRAFVPDGFEITDFQAAEIYSGKHPFTERVIRSVAVPAQAHDGSEWLLKFGINKARRRP